ncbi:hypothetical protein S245_011116, partial [Arachis hypogaea]
TRTHVSLVALNKVCRFDTNARTGGSYGAPSISQVYGAPAVQRAPFPRRSSVLHQLNIDLNIQRFMLQDSNSCLSCCTQQ